jgi:hypothetical protein
MRMDADTFRWLLAIRAAWGHRPEELAAMLRGDIALSAEARSLLAEFIDPGKGTEAWEARFRSVGPTDTEWIEFEAAIEYLEWVKTQPRGTGDARDKKLKEIARKFKVEENVLEELTVRMHGRRHGRLKLFRQTLAEEDV